MADETGALLGLYERPEDVAEALDRLRAAGFARSDVEVLSDSPYPEGAFGEEPVRHRLYVFPFVGAACGFVVGLLLTIGTQISYPLVTGGKPILSIPPMINVLYEGTMLGAIIFTYATGQLVDAYGSFTIPFVIAGVLPLVGYAAFACIAGRIRPVQLDIAAHQ